MAETAAPPAVVQLQGVRKAYNVGTPFETEVLHGIDLTVRRGEFCAVGERVDVPGPRHQDPHFWSASSAFSVTAQG